MQRHSSLGSRGWEVTHRFKVRTYFQLTKSRVSPQYQQRRGGASRAPGRFGYWRRMSAPDLSTTARILAVAVVFDALRAKRPYREALPLEKVFSIMRADSPRALDWPCLDALIAADHRIDFAEPGTEIPETSL